MTKRPARYALRLLVVAGVFAAVVGLGYLWRNSPLASIVADGRDDGGRVRGSGPAFSVSNVGDLLTTMLIVAGVMCFVIVVDKVRRRLRPVRPIAATVAPPGQRRDRRR